MNGAAAITPLMLGREEWKKHFDTLVFEMKSNFLLVLRPRLNGEPSLAAQRHCGISIGRAVREHYFGIEHSFAKLSHNLSCR